jgi:signal transduction histidine kinase
MSRSLAIFGVMLIITIAHYVIPTRLFLWHEILERLYYLPIIFAALNFGLIGGLTAAVCAGACYIPHILVSWHHSAGEADSKYAEIVVFLAVGAVTGALSDRERNRTNELRQTAEQLRMANANLEDSFRQLRRADRLSAVGQLAASLAHEIRNPLGSIEGAVDIVERSASEERRHEFLGIIKKEAKRLNGLLSNLLDFARPRTPQIRPVQIESIVRSVVDLTSHTARHQGIRLECEIEPTGVLVQCDAEQMTQALLNLTLNAIQATPTGGAVLISVRHEDDVVLIRVKDEGAGIDADDTERIFDPFYTTKEGGTGLGLPISYQIVTQHKGRITVERNPEVGMTFTLALPVTQHR